MSVVVFVSDNCFAVLGNGGRHELADHTAKISRHHERLKSFDSPRIELYVYEPEKVQEFLHCRTDMFGLEPAWDDSLGVEASWIEWFWSTCVFFVFCHLGFPSLEYQTIQFA